MNFISKSLYLLLKTFLILVYLLGFFFNKNSINQIFFLITVKVLINYFLILGTTSTKGKHTNITIHFRNISFNKAFHMNCNTILRFFKFFYQCICPLIFQSVSFIPRIACESYTYLQIDEFEYEFCVISFSIL